MKTNKLLALLLSTGVILAACGGNTDNGKSEDKAAVEKTETKDTKETKEASSEPATAKDVIAKAKDAAKDIKSYKATLDNEIKSGDNKMDVAMTMESDEKKQTKINTDSMGQKMEMYIFDKKVVISPDGKQYMDATKQLEGKVQDQLDQLDYQTAINAIDAYNDADFKKTAEGYELTQKIKDIEQYKEIAKANGSADMIETVEKQIKEISGTVTVVFDKDFKLLTSNSDIDMTMKEKNQKMNTVSKAKYSDYNEVPEIEIPEKAKDAESMEDMMKDTSTETKTDKTESSTKASS